MRRMTRAGAAAAAAVLVIGLAACGDDDDDATTDTTEAGGDAAADPAAFCDGLVEFNGLVMQVDLEDDASGEDVKEVGEQLAPLAQQMADAAPAALADAWSDLNDTAIQPLLEGDGEAFNSDDTFAAYTEVVGQAVEECGFESVGVTAIDYGFQGVPATMPAGNIAFELTNAGAEQHEMIVFRKADGVTQSIQEIVGLPEDQSESLVVFAGAAFAPPGESGSTLVNLEPGEYGMVCFIPVGSTGDVPPDSEVEGPPHFTQGMLTEFTVE